MFNFQKYAWIFTRCSFPWLCPWSSQHSHWSMSFCPSEQRQGQKYLTLYLKSCDRVPWVLPLQPGLLPSWFLKTRQSRVFAEYPAFHPHSSQLTVLLSCCTPTWCGIELFPWACLLAFHPHGCKSYQKQKKKKKEKKKSEKAKRAPCCWPGWGWIVS